MRSRKPIDPWGAALGWLAMRDLTAAEVAFRLRRRGVDQEAAAAVLLRLEEEGLVDDRRLCRATVRAALDRHRYGPGALRRYLASRGFSRDLAEEALAGVTESDWRAVAEGMRRRYDMGDPRERARFARHLQRQGFPAVVVAALLAEAPEAADGEPEKG